MCVGGGRDVICDNSTSFMSKDTAHRDTSPIAMLKDA